MVVAVLVDEFTSGKARACVHTLAPIYVRDEDRRGGSEAELGRGEGEETQAGCLCVWVVVYARCLQTGHIHTQTHSGSTRAC